MNSAIIRAICLANILLVAICSAASKKPIESRSESELESSIRVTRDQFTKTAKVFAVLIEKYHETPYVIFPYSYQLVGVKKEEGTGYLIVFCSRQMLLKNTSWISWDKMYDENGEKLELTHSMREVEGKKLIETVNVQVSKRYLESIKDSGMTFRIDGSTQKIVFTLPSAYIRSFLKVVGSVADS